MMASVKRILTLTGRNIKEILREPLSLIFMFALPFGMELLFYTLFHSAAPQFEMKYLAPGMVVFGQAFLTLFLGILIASDRVSSFVIRLYTTEIKPFEFTLSYALAMIPISLLQGALILATASVIDISFLSFRLLAVLAAGIVPSLLFIAFGILFGSICGEKSVGGVASIIVTVQSLLSGMWFPLEGISSGFVKVMDALPFKNAAVLLQNTASGNTGTKETLIPCLIVAAYAAVVFVISVAVYRRRMVQ